MGIKVPVHLEDVRVLYFCIIGERKNYFNILPIYPL